MVNQAIDERAAVQLMRKLQKRLGEETDGDRAKRSSEKVRERQAVERQRLAADIERHEAEIADLLRRRDGRMDGLGAVLTGAEMRDIERLIERKQRELRDWRRLMTEIPTPSAHAGNAKAKHRA